MSKRILCIILGVITVFVLPACNVNKTSTTSSNTASSTSQSSSTSTSSTSQKGIFPILMDIDALMQGNYDSILGTWQNAQGDSLIFNSKGLVTEDRALLGRGKIRDGVFETGYVDAKIGDVTLLMVPGGTQLSATYLTTGTDTSDSTRDRMIVISPASADSMEVYYRLSQSTDSGIDPLKNTETGVQLESGPKTIEYANAILGENNWQVIEGNYTRTESIPYNTIEGDDDSLYAIYQNGVIVNADYQIVYQP
ncbi:lipoprotein [Streptococcus parasuis]|nr:translation initiation factor 1 (IF-1) [Streptococcus suis]BCP57671.1 lipoprotein [Streptococcus parasuis]